MRALRGVVDSKDGPRSRPRFNEPRPHEDVVAVQYETPGAAVDYAQAHEGWGPGARYARSRSKFALEALASTPSGHLLDVGCGPGMILGALLGSRADDFSVTALDRSPEMVAACAARNDSIGQARMMVGRIEAMPFRSGSFDVVLAMGVLEYVESISAALAEVARVIRPGGLFLATMLNPASPYRFVEWHLYWPLLRVLRAVETEVNVPPARRHGPVETGIRAYRECALCKLLTAAGFEPRDIAGYDVNSLVPPIDSVARRWVRGWQKRPERTISRGRLKWLGTAYMVVAYKTSKSIGV